MVLLPLSLYAVSPGDVPVLVRHARALCLSAAASYAALSPVELPGVTIESDDSFIPYGIVLENADLGSFRDILLTRKGALRFLPLSVTRPFAEKAVAAIGSENIRPGDFIVSGRISIEGGRDISLSSLLIGKTESIDMVIAFDTVIYDRMLNGNASVSGSVGIRGQGGGKLIAECLGLFIDGVPYSFPLIEVALAV